MFPFARFKSRWAVRWRSGIVGAALSILAGLGCLESKTIGPWLRGLSYDLPFALRPAVHPAEAVIVSMDETSHTELHQDPSKAWNRALHVDLLGQVLALGARAVVFDVWFAEPWPDAVVDQRFSEALHASAGRVVLAAKLERRLEGGTNLAVISSSPLPPTALLASAAPWGVVDLPLDPDSRVRRHYTNANHTSLAWRVAEVLGVAPLDPLQPRWINFYGPHGAVPGKSYHEVLRGTDLLPAGYFSNQVVFVGRNPVVTSRGLTRGDEVHTPCTRWTGGASPGVEVQATVFLNLLNKDWLNELPRTVQYAVFVGCGLLFGVGLALVRPGVALWTGLLGAGLLAGAALWLVWQQRFWFPWLIVGGVQMPCALGWSVIAHTRWLTREKEDLERKLATTLETVAAAGASSPPAPDAGRPQRVPSVPDHTLLRCVGRGAYGEVWLARDLVGSYRAVKAVYRDCFPHAEPFEREFRGIQKYSPISRSHPGWLDILHVGRNEAEGCFFYIMEVGDDEVSGQQFDPERYVPRTLAGDLRRRGKLPLDECIELNLALADALAHLHKHSLIHRDIKPSNVIFVHGAPKFADIGLVTDISGTGREVSFLGTEGYIAPEGPGNPLADLYSLGKLIYEASTGRDRRAFPELPTDLAGHGNEPLSEQIYRIALKACEYEPKNRYQTAMALHADLLQLRRAVSGRRKA